MLKWLFRLISCQKLLGGGTIDEEATSYKVRQRNPDIKFDSDVMETSPTSSSMKIGPELFDQDRVGSDSALALLKQVTPPFFIAGIAMVLAGLYFEYIQEWQVFREVPEIIVLVPALLGLKGNLEMTLASRLSTEANLGMMNNSKDHLRIMAGNIALVQLQAVIIAILASGSGLVLMLIEGYPIIMNHIIMLFACCIATASIASFILTVVTGFIVIFSIYFKINPDNIATPMAASLGDITSILLISLLATELYKSIDYSIWICIIIIAAYVLLLPFLFWHSISNRHTSHVVYSGWVPIIVAMVISTVGGLALKMFMSHYKTLPAFQPVMNGVGGNLVSIQASRLSTMLHMKAHMGTLPESTPLFIEPYKIIYSGDSYSVTCRVLIGLAIPGQLLFAIAIMVVRNGFSLYSGSFFLVFYLMAALIQVYILLYCAYLLTLGCWKMNINPDTTTIPYLTAMGDFLGIMLLGLVYILLTQFGLDI